jgi:hypothetical protein
MRRRTFLTSAATTATLALGGCLGEEPSPTDDGAQTDDEHVTALRAEIDDRGVDLTNIDLDGDIVEVEHGYDEDPNDAIANVAMAFVERISEGWDVERLDGLLYDQGSDWTWHAEAEWAREYADGEIGPDEYGERLSETMSMVLETEE